MASSLFRDDWQPPKTESGQVFRGFDTREDIGRFARDEEERLRQERLARRSNIQKVRDSVIGRTLQPVRNVAEAIGGAVEEGAVGIGRSAQRLGSRVVDQAQYLAGQDQQPELNAAEEVLQGRSKVKQNYPQLEEAFQGLDVRSTVEAFRMANREAPSDRDWETLLRP